MLQLQRNFLNYPSTCTAPTKTFNLPGLKVSNIIIPNQSIRDSFKKVLKKNSIGGLNCLASFALEAAYNESEVWLDELRVYLKSNLEFLKKFIKKNLPKVRIFEPEGTFLVWLDFRGYGLDSKRLTEIIFKEARIALFEGWLFGKVGKGFERINIGCPRPILEEALNRLNEAFNNVKR